MPNAFRILKPIQKSSKCVWVFRNTGANAFAKNQTRLAYEDKRDLYCTDAIVEWLKIPQLKSMSHCPGSEAGSVYGAQHHYGSSRMPPDWRSGGIREEP